MSNTTLSEHIKAEELHRLELVWNRLTWLERKKIMLRILPYMALEKLERHIQRRQASFAYRYPAHWLY